MLYEATTGVLAETLRDSNDLQYKTDDLTYNVTSVREHRDQPTVPQGS